MKMNTRAALGGLYNRPPIMPIQLWRVATRPGSMDILAAPSRIGTTLYYPDGRIVKEGPK